MALRVEVVVLRQASGAAVCFRIPLGALGALDVGSVGAVCAIWDAMVAPVGFRQVNLIGVSGGFRHSRKSKKKYIQTNPYPSNPQCGGGAVYATWHLQ